VSQYAQPSDLAAFGLPVQALGKLASQPAVITGNLVAASTKIDEEALIPRYGAAALPLIAPYPQSVIEAACVIAAYRILSVRGFSGEDGADANFLSRYYYIVGGGPDHEIGWLAKIAKQMITLTGITLQEAPRSAGGPGFSQPTVITSSCVSVQSGAQARNRCW
jgi:hypothetical protein